MQTTECLVEALTEIRNDPRRVPDERFWKIVERYRATLINQAFCIIGSQEDAEDIAQETLCKAFTALHQLRDAAKLGLWLRSINHRHALALYRRRRDAREERLRTGQMSEIEAPAGAATGQHTTGGSPATSLRDRIARAMDGLPDGFREVMALRYWEKLSNEQIAARLDIPEGTVRSRLARADRMMSQKLKAVLKQENHPQ